MAEHKKLVWLDCDPGADDAMAIFMACYSPSISLLGISTVHGNASLNKVTINALKVLKMGGITGISVYKGLSTPVARRPETIDNFHGESGIDGGNLPETDQEPITEQVIHKIYLKIKEQKEKVHFVAVGCLSNLATLLTVYPDIKESIEQISLMGGSITLGNYTPTAEFNIAMDPEAAAVVFRSQLPLSMAPLDLTLKVQVNQSIISQIEAFNSPFSKEVLGFLTFYQASYKKNFNYDYSPLHDPCALYYIINPSAFTSQHRNVEIETQSQYCDGRTVVDVYQVTGRKPNCNVLIDLNQDLFWKEMMDALALSNKNSPLNISKEQKE